MNYTGSHNGVFPKRNFPSPGAGLIFVEDLHSLVGARVCNRSVARWYVIGDYLTTFDGNVIL